MNRIIRIFLSLVIAFSSVVIINSANASAAEQWTVEKVVYDDVGKSLSYTASRPNALASNDYVYKAKVGVNAARTGSTVASMIRYGLAGAAIIGIVEGVGWIIDNGVVKKKVDNKYNEGAYFYVTSYANRFGKPELAVKDFLSSNCSTSNPQYCQPATVICPSTGIGSGTMYCTYYLTNAQTGKVTVTYGNVTQNPTPIYENVPDLDLGTAIENSPSAPQVIPDIYSPNNPVPRPSPAPDAVQTALDNAPPEPRDNPKTDIKPKPNKDTDNDGIPDEYDPNLPSQGLEFELPQFCTWAATVCEWYVRYKEDSELVKKHREKELTFWEKVKDWFDWTKDDPNLPESEPLDISTLPVPALDENAISWGAQCPQDVQVPINMQGVSSTITFSWSPWCQLLSIIKPAIIASAYIGAAFIVLGLRT